MTDKADGSVVLAQLQIYFLGRIMTVFMLLGISKFQYIVANGCEDINSIVVT